MVDNFMTVATFNRTFEAQLAKNLLESEGIESILGGSFSSDVFFGSIAVEDQIVLQVRQEDAQRAASLLAAVAAARLDEDWEQQAESGAGVWICSICGEPISNRLSICHSCQTPRESIRATPRNLTAIQTDTATLPTGKEVQKQDEIADTPTPTPALAPPAAAPLPNEEEEIRLPPTARGDDLARKAFLASLFAAVMPVLMPVAWICILRVMLYGGEMSTKGVRQLFGAVLINSTLILVFLLLWAALRGLL